MEKIFGVFGIGNALMDTLIEIPEDIISKLELRKGAIVFHDEKDMQTILALLVNRNMRRAPGGSVANTMSGIASMGGSAAFYGVVGPDEVGIEYIRQMAASGVIVAIDTLHGMTGEVISLITPDKQRTFAVNLGVCPQLNPKNLPRQHMAQSRIIHLEGYGLYDERTRPAILAAMQFAKENGIQLSLDLSDFRLAEMNKTLLAQVLPRYVDILFANEEEAQSLTGIAPEQAVHELADKVRIAIVKLGKRGSLIKSAGTLHRIEPFPVTPIDTTGAGDMFAAGVLYGLSKDLPLDLAGKIGSFAASKIVSQMGARLTCSIAKEVNALCQVEHGF